MIDIHSNYDELIDLGGFEAASAGVEGSEDSEDELEQWIVSLERRFAGTKDRSKMSRRSSKPLCGEAQGGVGVGQNSINDPPRQSNPGVIRGP